MIQELLEIVLRALQGLLIGMERIDGDGDVFIFLASVEWLSAFVTSSALQDSLW